MMDQPKTCPFCGRNLVVLRDPSTGRVVTARHDQKVPCYLNEIAVSAVPPAFIDAWNSRPTGAIGFEIEDGLPVFNDHGGGKPVDSNFLNRCFDFIRKNRLMEK